MTTVAAFYFITDVKKPAAIRVGHKTVRPCARLP